MLSFDSTRKSKRCFWVQYPFIIDSPGLTSLGTAHHCQNALFETELCWYKNAFFPEFLRNETLKFDAAHIATVLALFVPHHTKCFASRLSSQYQKSLSEVNETFQFYVSMLEERKAEIARELEQAYSSKQVALSVYSQKAQETVDKIFQVSSFGLYRISVMHRDLFRWPTLWSD